MTAPEYVVLMPLSAITKTADIGDVLRARSQEMRERRRVGAWSPQDEAALAVLDHILGEDTPGTVELAAEPVDAPILLRLREAATLLGVSVSTVEELVARGDLPVVRIGKCVRVRRDELQTWLDVLTEQQRRRNGGAR